MNLSKLREEKVTEIESILRKYLPPKQGGQQKIMEAMEYALMAGGKRIRPMLMAETYDMFGGSESMIEPFMAALEMIHTYSLVHDDLPAMDDDDYRRGRETTHKVYGEAMGILTGDALLNYAFETACTAFEMNPESSARIAQALKVLSRKAGIYGMIGGQVIDIQEVSRKSSISVLKEVYRLKTSALMESAMMIGAILAGASQEEVEKVEKIASNVGLAFQIQDDILDVTGTDELLGKPAHSDEKNDKLTLTVLIGIEKAKNEVRRISEEAIVLLHELKRESAYLEWLLEALMQRKN